MDFDKFVNKGPIRTPQVKLYNKNIFYISYHHCYHDHDHQAFGSFPVFSWVICLMFLPPAGRLNQRIAGFLQNPSSPSFLLYWTRILYFAFVSAWSKICGVKGVQVIISVKGCYKIDTIQDFCFVFVFTTWHKLNRMLCLAFSFHLQQKIWFLARWTYSKLWSRYKKDTKKTFSLSQAGNTIMKTLEKKNIVQIKRIL